MLSEMERGKLRAHHSRCAGCGGMTPDYDIVNYGSIETGYRQLCSRCFNTEAAEVDGLDRFEHLQFEPVKIADRRGRNHTFHFRTHLFGPGVSIDAFELRRGSPAGYRFQVIGDPESDLLVLLGRLVEKIRRALSIEHVKKGEYGLQVADRVVRGRIDWDEFQEGAPLLVIDGREIPWQDFGRMLMTFEGWQFKLEIRDESEEV
jgi:hypothetical protein